MSNVGDKLKGIIDKPDIAKAMGTLMMLPEDELIIVSAFFVRLYSDKLNSNYLG